MNHLRKRIKPLKIFLILSYPSGINKPINQNEIALTQFNTNEPMKTRVIKTKRDIFIRFIENDLHNLQEKVFSEYYSNFVEKRKLFFIINT